IITMRNRKLNDEVHGDCLPWAAWDVERLKKPIRFVTRRLDACTRVTRLDIAAHIGMHPRPRVIS
ncbi:hypothetical protein BV25DRAFT_1814046, partial [Artomyces pyxidatus]